MKLSMKIDGPFSEDAAVKLESVFEKELPLVRPELGNYLEIEVSVTFLNQAEMRDVNKQYRGIDAPTDVLSFPLWDEELLPTPTLGVLPLGDILICPEETEKEHAPMPRIEALCLVLAHGFLHLLGWDHDSQEKEELMWERQGFLKSELLRAIGEAS